MEHCNKKGDSSSIAYCILVFSVPKRQSNRFMATIGVGLESICRAKVRVRVSVRGFERRYRQSVTFQEHRQLSLELPRC